jgi:hypothetical protein
MGQIFLTTLPPSSLVALEALAVAVALVAMPLAVDLAAQAGLVGLPALAESE